MEQGAHGHDTFPAGSACNAIKNGACFSLHGPHRETAHAGPAHECCTTTPYTAAKRPAAPLTAAVCRHRYAGDGGGAGRFQAGTLKRLVDATDRCGTRSPI